MRMLLTPYVQSDLGIVILKPGPALLPSFKYAKRLLICDEPKHLKSAETGLLPETVQALASNESIRPFLTASAVILAAGGKGHMKASIERKKCCQLSDEHCHNNLTLLEYRDSAICLCWHHENKVRHWTLPDLDELAERNTIEWVLGRILCDLRMDEDHQLTMAEVCWWSVVNKVYNQLPEDIARSALNLPVAPLPGGEMKEVDIRPYDDRALPIINDRATIAHEYWSELDKPVIQLTVDPEPPTSFMLRPKLAVWECDKYKQWVKKQPCVCCGDQADDPHHIINVGLGGSMGAKQHDFFTIPVCRVHHNQIHEDVQAWESEYGSQLMWVVRTQNKALVLKVIV